MPGTATCKSITTRCLVGGCGLLRHRSVFGSVLVHLSVLAGGDTWIKGFGTVSYAVTDKVTGKEEEREYRWNTRALLLEDLGAATNDPRRKDMLANVRAASYDQIVKDPKMMEFVRSVGKGLFGDNCAACHGRGGQGVVGMYPNLTDDDWLWGGGMDQVRRPWCRAARVSCPRSEPCSNPINWTMWPSTC